MVLHRGMLKEHTAYQSMRRPEPPFYFCKQLAILKLRILLLAAANFSPVPVDLQVRPALQLYILPLPGADTAAAERQMVTLLRMGSNCCPHRRLATTGCAWRRT